MAQSGYKSLISYNLALVAFRLGWEFANHYYPGYEYSRQRDQIKQALRSHKQNIVEGSAERSLSAKLKLYDVAKSSGMEALEDFEDILRFEKLPRWSKGEGQKETETVANYLVDVLTRFTYLLDRQMNAVEKKHQTEGGYNENLLKKRLAYRKGN